ncbi:MAG: AsmA-like C-terminal region-containing protein [Crocinitomicaceae bacterium]
MDTSEKKKKKSIVKRILKWSGISFLLLLLAIILIPIFFKDKIKDLVLEEVNKTLTAKVELDEFDLTFLSTFPNLSVQLDGVRVKGTGDFDGVTLADVKTLRADVGFWDVVKGETISIDAIYLNEPKVDVRVLYDGRANFDIVKPDSLKTEEEKSEPSNFKLELKKYAIENADVRYDDKQGGLYANIVKLNHIGKGDLTADVVDFETKTTADAITFEMGGLSYLSKVKTDIVANLLLEFNENASKFTLKENTFQLNALKFGIDGFYEQLADKANMDLALKADKATFKEFISLIPAFYRTGYEGMLASGSLALNAKVKGVLDDTNMPGWDAGIKVANASIKYPDLPGKINNIAIVAKSQFAGGSNLDKMTVDVDKFHADFVGNVVDATLKLRNVMTDPAIASTLLAKVDLATLGKVIPLAEGETYNGKLDADVSLDGRMSYIEKENYEAFKALGTLNLKDFKYVSPELTQEVQVNEMQFRFAPQYLALEKLDAKTGNSDFAMNGTIDNYMGYIFRDELLKGKFTFNSNNLDLDQLMNIVPASADTTAQQPAAASTTEEAFEIPGNIDFALNTNINKVKFNGMDATNVQGAVTLKDKIATLNNLNLNAMGGSIGLTGQYNTQNPQKPKAAIGYNLKELDIQQLANNFLTIEKLAPIAKYVQGKISSNFNLSTDLTSNFEPVLNSVNGLGDLLSSSVSISNLKIFDKLEDVTKLANFNNQTIKNLKASFKIQDGKLAVNPFDILLGGIKTTISGTNGLDQSIDYIMKMNIPKEKLPKEMIKLVEDAVAKVNKLAPKLNLDVIPAQIPISANIIGTFKDPKINTDFKEKLMDLSGNMKDALKDKANEVVNQVKDSVKTVVNNAVEKGKEELEKQKQQILNSAQKQADNVKAEGKKAADKIRSEADKAYQQAVDAVSNPLAKKAAEVTAKKAKDEAYKKAQQAENEANKQADAIMQKARDEADKLK